MALDTTRFRSRFFDDSLPLEAPPPLDARVPLESVGEKMKEILVLFYLEYCKENISTWGFDQVIRFMVVLRFFIIEVFIKFERKQVKKR